MCCILMLQHYLNILLFCINLFFLVFKAVVQKALFNLTLTSKDGYFAAVQQNLRFDIKLHTTERQLLALNISFEPGKARLHRLSDDFYAPDALDTLSLSESYGLHRCVMHFHIFHRYRTVGNYTPTVSVSLESNVLTTSLPQEVQVFEPISAILPFPAWEKVVQTGVNTFFSAKSTVGHVGSKCQWNITKNDETVLSLVNSEWSFTTCFRSPGFYLLSVMCSNMISTSRHTEKIEAQEAIMDLNITGSHPRYVQSDHSIHLDATVSQGSNITVVWITKPDEALLGSAALTARFRFPQPGLFLVTVIAQNNVSSAIARLEVIVQDSVGELLLSLLNIITVHHATAISVTTSSGSNISLEVFLNGTLMFHSKNCLPSSSLELSHTFDKTGTVQVFLRATNQVSMYTLWVNASVVEELHLVAIQVVNQPVLGEDIILAAKINGFLWQNHYMYQWTLANNSTNYSGSPIFAYRCRELGLHPVYLTVTNMASTASIQSWIHVKRGAAGQHLSHHSVAAMGEPVAFTLKKLPTSITDAVISFGDGMQTYISGSSSVDHSYKASGIYNISATLNGKPIFSLIDVQEPLDDLRIEGPTAIPLSYGLYVPTIVTWSARIGRGSSCLYQWVYSNGTVNSTALGPQQPSTDFVDEIESQHSGKWTPFRKVDTILDGSLVIAEVFI
ncbi:polycystin-1-like [Ambystoma mexicanum]|uniref:polycystin-1-like n=1 Tax=Ambystoma mexicanum TaxID=8296 RepID=UPI0037E773C7